MWKKLFLYLAKKIRLNTGCDAPFTDTNSIDRDYIDYKKLRETNPKCCSFETYKEVVRGIRQSQQNEKSWMFMRPKWHDDVHTMD